jgi:hypothetical protein
VDFASVVDNAICGWLQCLQLERVVGRNVPAESRQLARLRALASADIVGEEQAEEV